MISRKLYAFLHCFCREPVRKCVVGDGWNLRVEEVDQKIKLNWLSWGLCQDRERETEIFQWPERKQFLSDCFLTTILYTLDPFIFLIFFIFLISHVSPILLSKSISMWWFGSFKPCHTFASSVNNLLVGAELLLQISVSWSWFGFSGLSVFIDKNEREKRWGELA